MAILRGNHLSHMRKESHASIVYFDTSTQRFGSRLANSEHVDAEGAHHSVLINFYCIVTLVEDADGRWTG